MRIPPKNWFILPIILLTAGLTYIFAMWQLDSSGLPASFRSHILPASILPEDREIIIHLPESYSESESYPTIYVVGGNSLSFHIATELDILSRLGYFRPCVLVGIPSPDQARRQRDLTPPGMKQDLDDRDSPEGKADIFLDFMEQEVIPFVQQTYPVNEERILIGHSREGLMCTYSIIHNPTLFKGRIALSPAYWREDNKFARMLEQFFHTDSLPGGHLFISLGEEEVPRMKKGLAAIESVLEQNAPPTLSWEIIMEPGADHQLNPYKTASLGLKSMLAYPAEHP